MSIETLKCPLNNKPAHRGPWNSGGIISTGGQYPIGDPKHINGTYNLTDEELRLFEKLSPLPKPERKRVT